MPIQNGACVTTGLDSAVRPLSSPTLTVPVSERLCDTVVAAFALWTLSAHAVVAAGGGLVVLLLLYAAVLAASLWMRLKWGALRPRPDSTHIAAPTDSPPTMLVIFRGAALVAGVGVALSYAARPDVLHLWWSAVILLGFAAIAVYLQDPPEISPAEGGRSPEMLLWLLAAAGVVLTLISHRPDADDAFYVNVAVAAADDPGWALLSADTLHGIKGLPLHLPVYRVHTYELLNGALAYLTGIPAIYSFHWLSAAFAGLLVPLAHAKLLRILTPQRWLATVATLLFILVAVGETHRWYGNFSFVRIWQGKSIFLFVFMPLVYAYALRFAVRPNLRDWTLLAGAQIAAVGCSSSALWLAPAGAFMALASAVRPSAQGLKTLVLGALASVYVLTVGWHVRSLLVGPYVVGRTGAPDADPAPLLPAALITVLGDSRLLIFGIAAILTAWVFAPTGLARRFSVVLPLAVFLGLLNPYLATWMPATIIAGSYWRSMWVLPLPILMALILTSPLPGGGGSSNPRRAAWLALLVAFALLIPRFSGVSAENGVRIGWPGLKVPEPAYRWAAAMNESAPPGSHVAVPPDIAVWIPTFHHHLYPLAVRSYLRPRTNPATQEEMFNRMGMQRFLAAPELVEATPQPFRDGLDRYAVRAVCLVNSPRAGPARAILQQAGFRPTLRGEDYELWVRPGPGPNARKGGGDR